MLFTPVGDRGIDALGHGVAERADVPQYLIVGTGESRRFIAPHRRNVREDTLDRGFEPRTIVVAELTKDGAAAGRRMGQHPLDRRLARLAGQFMRTGVEELEGGR